MHKPVIPNIRNDLDGACMLRGRYMEMVFQRFPTGAAQQCRSLLSAVPAPTHYMGLNAAGRT
jgi:hypothetical protein